METIDVEVEIIDPITAEAELLTSVEGGDMLNIILDLSDNEFTYTVPEINGKTIDRIQYENELLVPGKNYTHNGSDQLVFSPTYMDPPVAGDYCKIYYY